MSKQTAVDLLVSILNKEGFAPVLTNEEIQHFKQMEKEQMIDAIVQVMMKQLNICSESGIIQLVNNAEQYYNENYGGQDETL